MSHYAFRKRQRATERVHGAALVRIAAKSPSYVRAWQTRKAKRLAAVMAHCAIVRASMVQDA